MKKRILAFLMAVVMTVGLLPMSALAAGSDHAVTVGFTAVDCVNGEIVYMRKELTVEPGLAARYLPTEPYGYGQTQFSELPVGDNDVTPIDVLVAAHLEKYGNTFNNQSVSNYISSNGLDFIGMMFQKQSDITYTVNGVMPYLPIDDPLNSYGYNLGYGINQYIVQDNDEICMYYIDYNAYPSSVYASFEQEEVEVNTGEAIKLKLRFSTTGYTGEIFPAANTDIWFLTESGSMSAKSEWKTDNDGNVTVSFAEAGTYYLTCTGTGTYMGDSDWDGVPDTEMGGALSPAYCKVTVKEVTPPVVDVTEVTLDKETLSLEVGGTDTLTATVKPDDATDPTVTWTSSKEEVATVDSTGKVTAVAAGEATITATAGGKSASCAVTVEAPAANPNEIDATVNGTKPSNIVYIDKITIGDTVSVQEATFDGLTCNIVLAPGTAPDATVEFAFSYEYMEGAESMASVFNIAFDESSDIDADGKGSITLDGGSGTALVNVVANLSGNQSTATWTLNFSTALDTTNNEIDATVNGTKPSNIVYIDKITIGDTVSVQEATFDGLTCNIVLAPGTAPDATVEFAFSYEYMEGAESMASVFNIAFDESSDVDADGKGSITLDGGSGTALVNVVANLSGNQSTATWTLKFSTASGGASTGSNKNTIPVEIAGNLWDDIYIGIQQFMFRDCKVLDYNWADEGTLNVWVSDATADDGSLKILYNMRFADGTDIDVSTPHTVQLQGGRATVKYNITPKGAYDLPEHADAAHSITVNISNKGLTFPALADGVAAEASASVGLGEAYIVDLNSIFSDAESDSMTYSVNIDGEGTVAADAQYSYTAPMVGEYELVFKAHDGMNWSTETYTVNLTVTDTEETYTFTAKVPDAITPTFSATKGFREDGTDWAGSALTATKGESANGWTSYTVTVPGSVDWVSVRGTDGTNDWGGMAFLAEQDAVITLRQVEAVINSKVVINGEQFFPTAEQAVFKVEYADEISTRYAVSGGSFTDEYGYLGYRFLLVAADNDMSYTYYAVPLEDLTKNYATNIGTVKTITTESADIVTTTLPLGTASSFTITAPEGAEVRMFSQTGGNYYGGHEIPVYEEKDNDDGTVTYTYSETGNGAGSYRVSMEGEITKAGYVSGEGVTVSWDGDDRGPAYTREYEFDEKSYYYRADDSMVVNLNYRNNLLLNVGDTHTLRSYRIWQIINNDTKNVMIEPDFHIREIANDGVISLSPYAGYHGNATGNRMDITALKAGTAILEVTYDAIEIMERTVGSGEIGGIGGLTFNACDPNRTALIVVQVGTEETDINFGILNNGGNVWDAECDTVYFLEEKGEISFEPTIGNGSISKVEVSGDKGASWTELTGVNGEYTAEILPGNNIIRITKADGAVSYQLVRGEQITYSVAERTQVSGQQTADGDGIIEAGEAVMISIHGGHVPFGKMAGISNPWTFLTKYNFNGTETKSGSGMYQYAHVNQVYLTIPEDAEPGDELSLTDGYTMVHTLFGSGGGAYRDAGDVVPPNLNAPDNISGAYNIFPDLTITVGGEAPTIPVTSVTLNESAATVEVGKDITLSARVFPSDATDQTVTWTSSNSSVATVVGGVVTGIASGEATITATAGDKSASCVVTVTEAVIDDPVEDELDFDLAENEIVGYVTVSFEDNGIRKSSELSSMEAKFRSPLGTIIAPTEVPFKAYDTIASVTLRLLDAMNFTASHDGNEFSNFYLSAIGDFSHNDTYYASFGEFDAGQGSGWMITQNDWFINKGASEFRVQNGDVIEWQYTCQLGADIGGNVSDDLAANQVEALIDAIGTVTKNSGSAIQAARTAYDSLTTDQKALVKNYSKLTAAETAYNEIMATQVETLINAIGTVTKNSGSAIQTARTAYDSLTADQKTLVKNYSKLTAAEKAYDEIMAGQVEALIDAIGTVTKDSGPAIQAARTAYDKLTDAQKLLVDNYSTLAVAEKVYASLMDMAHPFTDAVGHWAEEAIAYVYQEGLMTGTKANRFDPETSLSRAMLVTILYRMEGEPVVTDSNTFSDVKDGTWYTDAVIWAAEQGIVNGVGKDRFAPNNDITREQMATMLLRYSDYKDYDTTAQIDLSGYTDADQISTWALDALRWANAEGLITGRKADLLVPQGDTTRAETATILMRYLETIA